MQAIASFKLSIKAYDCPSFALPPVPVLQTSLLKSMATMPMMISFAQPIFYFGGLYVSGEVVCRRLSAQALNGCLCSVFSSSTSSPSSLGSPNWITTVWSITQPTCLISYATFQKTRPCICMKVVVWNRGTLSNFAVKCYMLFRARTALRVFRVRRLIISYCIRLIQYRPNLNKKMF
jgi:hypothetical protein